VQDWQEHDRRCRGKGCYHSWKGNGKLCLVTETLGQYVREYRPADVNQVFLLLSLLQY
jgi:hypothetical protein